MRAKSCLRLLACVCARPENCVHVCAFMHLCICAFVHAYMWKQKRRTTIVNVHRRWWRNSNISPRSPGVRTRKCRGRRYLLVSFLALTHTHTHTHTHDILDPFRHNFEDGGDIELPPAHATLIVFFQFSGAKLVQPVHTG